MATPESGALNVWITDRLSFRVIVPVGVSTGGLDTWLTDRVPLTEFAKGAEVAITGTGAEAAQPAEIAATGAQYPLWLTAAQVADHIALSWA